MMRFVCTVLFVLIAYSFTAFAVPSAKDFGTLPALHDVALSPDGTEIAVLVNKDGQYVIRVLTLNNMNDTSRLIGLGAKMKPEYLKWVNNERLIVSF